MPSWKKVITSGSNAALNSLNVTTAFTASGLNYPTTDNGEGSFLQTDGSGNLSFQYVKTIYENIYNGEATTITKGTPLYVSGSQGAASIVYRADAGNASKMPVIYISADNIASGATGRGIALGLITGVNTTGYPPGTEIYVAVEGGWTSTRPTGSAIVQTLGYVTKEGNGGQGVVLNPGPNSLPNLPSGSVWVGNSSSIPVAVPTSSLSVASASFAQTASFTTAVTGTTNYISKFTGTNTLGNSQIFDNGTNVGIGTTSPSDGFHISGTTKSVLVENQGGVTTGMTLKSTRSGWFQSINIFGGTSIANGQQMQFGQYDNGKMFFFNSGNFPIGFYTNGTEKLSITATGNTGIGVTTPAYKLHVIDSSSIGTTVGSNVVARFSTLSGGKDSTIQLSDGVAYSSRISMLSGDLHLSTEGKTSAVTVKVTTGNVGIGTTTPNSKLDVNGNTTITGSLAVSQSLLQYSNITSVTSGSTSNVASFNTSSYTAAFFDYVTTSGASARAGTVFTVWNGTNIEYTETSTNDIGNTNNLVLSASLLAGAVRLQATSLSGSWSVKTLARMI